MPANSLALTGLTAHLDRLCHRCDPSLPPETPHAFAYYITIRNASEHTVTLLGRKWVVEHADGTRQVTEGDKIVGETPRLERGEHYSYDSYMLTGDNARSEEHTSELQSH